MRENPRFLVSGNWAGIERVLSSKGTYGFFMETTSMEYYLSNNCDLMQLDSPIEYKSYGFAVRKGSPLRDQISEVLISLQESGYLAELKAKWWKPRDCEKRYSDIQKSIHFTLNNMN